MSKSMVFKKFIKSTMTHIYQTDCQQLDNECYRCEVFLIQRIMKINLMQNFISENHTFLFEFGEGNIRQAIL